MKTRHAGQLEIYVVVRETLRMPESSYSPDKTPKRQGRYKPKGRQVDPARLRAVEDVLQPHLQKRVLQRDRLIEYLHILQDKIGYLSAADLAALAELMLSLIHI